MERQPTRGQNEETMKRIRMEYLTFKTKSEWGKTMAIQSHLPNEKIENNF